MLLNIEHIEVGGRLRAARPERVAALAESIAKLGLQSPISVVSGVGKRGNGGSDVVFALVAGLHRLEACKSLGLVEIEATVVQMDDDERLLWEIDENLCRAELTELERGEHLLKRKEIYERKWPQSKAGAAQAAGMNRALGHDVTENSSATFAEDTAAKVGVTDRAIRQSIRRARKIDPKVRDRIRDISDIADSGVELDALADLDPQQQRKAVALVEAGQAHGIRDAKKMIDKRPAPTKPQPTADELFNKLFDKYLTALKALPPEAYDRAHEELLNHFDRPVADNSPALRVVS